jgi:hypothetical protein
MFVKIKEEGLGPLRGGRQFPPSSDDGKIRRKRKKWLVVVGTEGNPSSMLG